MAPALPVGQVGWALDLSLRRRGHIGSGEIRCVGLVNPSGDTRRVSRSTVARASSRSCGPRPGPGLWRRRTKTRCHNRLIVRRTHTIPRLLRSPTDHGVVPTNGHDPDHRPRRVRSGLLAQVDWLEHRDRDLRRQGRCPNRSPASSPTAARRRSGGPSGGTPVGSQGPARRWPRVRNRAVSCPPIHVHLNPLVLPGTTAQLARVRTRTRKRRRPAARAPAPGGTWVPAVLRDRSGVLPLSGKADP